MGALGWDSPGQGEITIAGCDRSPRDAVFNPRDVRLLGLLRLSVSRHCFSARLDFSRPAVCLVSGVCVRESSIGSGCAHFFRVFLPLFFLLGPGL